MIKAWQYLRNVTTLSRWLVFRIVVWHGIRFDLNKGRLV